MTSKAILFFIIIFAALTATNGTAAPVQRSSEKVIQTGDHQGTARLTVELSSDSISVTENLTMTIEVLEPSGTTANFPAFAELGFATDFNERSQRFRVTDISELARTRQDDNSTMVKQTYTLAPWLSGDYAILPILVTFTTDKDSTENQPSSASWQAPLASLMTDGIRIKVSPLPAERSNLSDLFGQAELDEHNLSQKERRAENKSDEEIKREEEDKKAAILALEDKSFPWWIIWTILTIMVAAPAFWLLGRKKIKEMLAPKKVPAHIKALEALALLQKKDLPSQGMLKEYYYQLSFILREFIGGRFKIYADKQTSEEFFQQLLTNNPFDQMSEQTLRDFSDLADTVKYSLYRPDHSTAEQSYQTARSFIEQNIPQNEGEE